MGVPEEDQDDPVENEPNALNLEDDEDLEAEFGGNDEEFDGPSIVLDPEQLDGEADLIAEADGIFEQWMEFTPKFGEYLIEGSKPLLSNKTTGKVSFGEIVSKFDTRGYFRTHGLAEYPSITLLARVHFSTMFNGGFQERVFSSCKTVMGVDQTRMPMEHLEMKALVYQNADLIRKGII